MNFNELANKTTTDKQNIEISQEVIPHKQAYQELKKISLVREQELENSLLKQALIESKNDFAALKIEQDKSLKALDQIITALESKINRLQNSNWVLADSIREEISRTQVLAKETITKTQDSAQEIIIKYSSKLAGIIEDAEKYHADHNTTYLFALALSIVSIFTNAIILWRIF